MDQIDSTHQSICEAGGGSRVKLSTKFDRQIYLSKMAMHEL